MYIYESKQQETRMMKDFQEIVDIYAPVNVINEHGVFRLKNTSVDVTTSTRSRPYNILPNTTRPIQGQYRINTVVVPYDSAKEEDIHKINRLIRRLGHMAEWFMLGDAEDMEKEYNTIPSTLKASIYPYQVWVWIKYIQEKRQLLASVSSNSERNEVKRAIDTAVQNIKDNYKTAIYPGCTTPIVAMAQNGNNSIINKQTEFNNHFRVCYKDFMIQLYIAIYAEGLDRTSKPVQDMIKTMKDNLENPAEEFMEAIELEREKAKERRYQTYTAPLENTGEGVDPLMPRPTPNSNPIINSGNIHVYGSNSSNVHNSGNRQTTKYEENVYTAENMERIGGIPSNLKLGGGSKRKTRRRTTKRTRHMRKSRRHH